MSDPIGTGLLLAAVIAQAVGCWVAWSWGRQARRSLQRTIDQATPEPPSGWQPRHRLSALNAPTRRYPALTPRQ
ncbi:hypothetical protein O7622_11340 [Micromonospora sp. WMMD1076]|uniref:hypothetical protein n=1 Tax=Micromonospora sp. WMMD1076 TaxID=3016103 RepID=UPI00249C4EAF|nr:hypothetical protein [Micromonospora sp. WMMD1076]WFF09104.1 hypothetical protein O7622_11340 [Micromonospora sp. WMMD1076]